MFFISISFLKHFVTTAKIIKKLEVCTLISCLLTALLFFSSFERKALFGVDTSLWMVVALLVSCLFIFTALFVSFWVEGEHDEVKSLVVLLLTLGIALVGALINVRFSFDVLLSYGPGLEGGLVTWSFLVLSFFVLTLWMIDEVRGVPFVFSSSKSSVYVSHNQNFT